MKTIYFEDLKTIEYGEAWDLQESLFQKGVETKSRLAKNPELAVQEVVQNHLLLCQHPHVYTLGKHGSKQNLLIDEEQMKARKVTFYKTNRGGDITYHGPGQFVAYPILDLEQFTPDLRQYMRSLEESVILLLKEYNIDATRLDGAIGVWLDADKPGKQRKICAMGVRSSRWMTLHGLALNVNTDLTYFTHIVPCGITDKSVTSIAKELGRKIDEQEVKEIFLDKFAQVFQADLSTVAKTLKKTKKAVV